MPTSSKTSCLFAGACLAASWWTFLRLARPFIRQFAVAAGGLGH